MPTLNPYAVIDYLRDLARTGVELGFASILDGCADAIERHYERRFASEIVAAMSEFAPRATWTKRKDGAVVGTVRGIRARVIMRWMKDDRGRDAMEIIYFFEGRQCAHSKSQDAHWALSGLKMHLKSSIRECDAAARAAAIWGVKAPGVEDAKERFMRALHVLDLMETRDDDESDDG